MSWQTGISDPDRATELDSDDRPLRRVRLKLTYSHALTLPAPTCEPGIRFQPLGIHSVVNRTVAEGQGCFVHNFGLGRKGEETAEQIADCDAVIR